jgi:hypothetical protein
LEPSDLFSTVSGLSNVIPPEDLFSTVSGLSKSIAPEDLLSPDSTLTVSQVHGANGSPVFSHGNAIAVKKFSN